MLNDSKILNKDEGNGESTGSLSGNNSTLILWSNI